MSLTLGNPYPALALCYQSGVTVKTNYQMVLSKIGGWFDILSMWLCDFCDTRLRFIVMLSWIFNLDKACSLFLNSIYRSNFITFLPPLLSMWRVSGVMKTVPWWIVSPFYSECREYVLTWRTILQAKVQGYTFIHTT